MEHEGVTPDLMTVGKSLAAGLPLAGVVGRAEVMDAPGVGQLGGTYGGNPLACAAANAVLASFEQDAGILARARKVGERVEQTFLAWKERFPIIGDVRSLGPMAALELISDPKTRKEGADEARAVADYAWQHGLLLMRAGMKGHVIRTLMPVVIDEKDLAEGLSILEDALGCASAL